MCFVSVVIKYSSITKSGLFLVMQEAFMIASSFSFKSLKVNLKNSNTSKIDAGQGWAVLHKPWYSCRQASTFPWLDPQPSHALVLEQHSWPCCLRSAGESREPAAISVCPGVLQGKELLMKEVLL